MIRKALCAALVLAGLGITTAANASIIPRATHLTDHQIACTLTNPEYTLNPGGSYLRIKQGHVGFTAYHQTDYQSGGWNDPYIVAGYDQSVNSQACNGHATISGVRGRSYPIPAPLGHAGRYTGSSRNWTSAGFAGDTGYDIWLTRNPHNNTLAKMLTQGYGTTEVMLWISHPQLYYYHSRGSVVIDHRRWDVIKSIAGNGSGRHWLRVFFISPHDSAGEVVMSNLYLNPFLSYAIRSGYLNPKDYLMSIDEGGEFMRGSMVAEGYNLKRST
jgi:hypothetical protein